MSPKLKRKFLQTLPFFLSGIIFGTVYAIIELSLLGDLRHYPATGNIYDPVMNTISTIVQASIFGLFFGLIEVFLLDQWTSGKSFLRKFILKSIFYILLIFGLIVCFGAISLSLISGESIFSPELLHKLKLFLQDMSLWAILFYIGPVFAYTILLSEMSRYLGDGVFRKFIFGKYMHPREEDRIFMFLDMKDSTSLAEKMGHVRYFQLLNKYYADISDAIIASDGEIYQYVGDEVVVTWALKNKTTYDNCITCFFRIKAIVKTQSPAYMQQFGHIPRFKAGMHCGTVTTGRIGILKKEIVFTGDVLNTTSRIQSVCNSYHVDNLLSEPLVFQLKKVTAYTFHEVGLITLRGKEEPLKLYTV